MKTLHLVLKSKWYDKIASGEKTSEYRECKPYWNKRLSGWENIDWIKPINGFVPCDKPKYNTVTFHRGYTAHIMRFEIVAIGLTTHQNDLNLPKCWEIKLGKRIK